MVPQEVTFNGQMSFDGKPFLTMFVPDGENKSLEELVRFIREEKSSLKEKLIDSGGLLFRGWDLKDGKDFNAVVDAFGFSPMPYAQGEAKRFHIHGRVFTANATPVEQEIPFHSEMAYLSPAYPDVILFFCETPSPQGQGGGTAFARGDVAFKKIAEKMPEFVKKLETDGIIYSYTPQKGWEATFDTSDRTVAEERAQAMNARLEWDENGEATVFRGPFAPTLKHPMKGSVAWFNSLGLNFKKGHLISYGDGLSIPEEDIRGFLNIMKEDQVLVQWEKGDIVVADNLGVMHARMPGKLPRSILVSLGKN